MGTAGSGGAPLPGGGGAGAGAANAPGGSGGYGEGNVGAGAASAPGGSGGVGGTGAVECGARALTLDASGNVLAPECGLDGSWYWYADGAGTTVSGAVPNTVPYRAGKGMCLAGRVKRDATYAAWGAGVGFLTKAWTGEKLPWDSTTANVVGFEVTVTGTTGMADLRAIADHQASRPTTESPPFVTLDGPRTHRFLFDDFAVPAGWTPNGGEKLDPSLIRYLNFQVMGGDVEADFDFCISNVAPIVADPIDDLEDGNDSILARDGRSGSWYPYGDGTGTQTATLGHVNAPGGYGNGRGAATQGSGFVSWGAGIGLNFRWDAIASRPLPYDAARFAGIRLRARGTAVTRTLRVSPYTQAVTTVDNGGTCSSNCVDPHFWVVPLEDAWHEYLLPFTHLFQNGTQPGDFDPSRALGLNFQVPAGGAFDVVVDDVAFYRSAAPRPDPDPNIGITVESRRTDPLLPAGFRGLWAFPDQAVLRLDLGTTQRFFLSAWPAYGYGYPSSSAVSSLARQPTFALDAPGPTQLTAPTAGPTEVLSPGAGAAFDNGYAGLSGLYRHTDGRLYGFYHAEDWLTAEGQPTPRIPSTVGGAVEVPGFYASVAAAVSDDDGLHFAKLGQVLTSALPKQWPASGEPPAYDQGVCGPGAVVDRNGRYLLLYYTDNSRQDGRSVQLSLARADLRRGPPVADTFQKYYLGAFGPAGLAGAESPLPGQQAYLVNPTRSYGHPVWSEYLKRYAMVLNVGTWDSAIGDLDKGRSGIYVMFSEDGLYWSAPRQLVSDYVYFKNGRSFSYQGTILFDDATGRSGWLVYGHSERWGDPTHYMVGHRVTFTLP